MTWYNENYKNRQIVGVDVFGGSAGTPSSIDLEVTMPKDWDQFWDNIRTDMYDVVATDRDGNLLSFSRKTGANYSTRTLVIQVDNYLVKDSDSMSAIYIYYNNPAQASDLSVVTTITTPKKAYIMLDNPHSRIISANISTSALDIPIQTFTKGTGESIHVYFMYGSIFAKRITPYNDRSDLEGIDFVTVHSYDNLGADNSSRYIEADTRLGNGFIRATFTAGENNTDYAISVKITTTQKQILEPRAIIRVINLLPS